MTRGRRSISALVAASLAWATLAPPVSALPYDGTNPGATECGNGTNPVTVLESAPIMSGTTRIGKVELRHSRSCATVWSRVYNETNAAVDVREKLIYYDTSNGAGATTNTETDTLQREGVSPDSGWSKQYRDRPAFRARGEIFHNGAWRWAQTDMVNGYNQFDGNFPNNPRTCDNTATNICHRWPTTGAGGPTTIYYAFQTSTLAILNTSPVTDWNQVTQAYEDLSGPSPNFSLTSLDNESYEIYAYDDSADTAYARTQTFFTTEGPQLYYYGYTKINDARNANVTSWDALACHEIGHLLGFLHVYEGAYRGSEATCMGYSHSRPQIDDQQFLTKIYPAPAGS